MAELQRLEERLRSQGWRVFELIADGLEPVEVETVLEDLAGVAPAELVTWFSWHDGLAETDGWRVGRMMLIGAWTPYSLAESVAYVREGPQWAGGGPKEAAGWLPLVYGPIGQGQGQRMLIAVWGHDARVRVVRSAWGDGALSPVTDSLVELVEAWHGVLDDGLHWDVEEDFLSTKGVPSEAQLRWSRTGVL